MERLFKYLKKLFVTYGLTNEEYKSVRSILLEGNRFNLIAYSIFCSVYISVMSLVQCFGHDKMSAWYFYFPFATASIVILIISITITKKNIEAVRYLVYAIIAVSFSFTIILGTVADRQRLTVSFFVLAMIALSMFTDRPYRVLLLILFTNIVYIILEINFKEKTIFATDITNAVIFGFSSVLISVYQARIKAVKALNVKLVEVSSLHDALTGILNRACYEKNVDQYSNIEKDSICTVYIDVNGLHELNNTKGHDAGDIMLKTIADEIMDVFGINDSYRIGGDEFVAFVLNKDENEVSQMTTELVEKVKKDGYGVAVGYALSNETPTDLYSILKKSETMMYENKKKYYEENNLEERS